MAIKLTIRELNPPQLQFGGVAATSDPKIGLDLAGPFDLRFGAARQTQVKVRPIGRRDLVDQTRRWLERCRSAVPVLGTPSLLQKLFPGFAKTFHMSLVDAESWTIHLDGESHNSLERALSEPDEFKCFQKVVDVYSEAHARLAMRDTNRPDVVIMCIPDDVLKRVRSVERDLTTDEKKKAKAISKSRENRQMDMFDMLQDVEQTEEDFLKRDLRHALKLELWRTSCRFKSRRHACWKTGHRVRIRQPVLGTLRSACTTKLEIYLGDFPPKVPRRASLVLAFTTSGRHSVTSFSRPWRRHSQAKARDLPYVERASRRKRANDEICTSRKIKPIISRKCSY